MATALPIHHARSAPKISTLQIALAVSVLLHLVLLAIRFADPQVIERVFQEQPLEVILVNARSQEAPTKAQAVAQVQLAGGGEAAQGRATSPLPATATARLGDAAEDATQKIEQMQQEQQQLLARVRREVAMLPLPDPARAATDPAEREQMERRRRLMDLLAEIEKRINEENARPKKRYISPATREEAYAIYYDGLRRKIEDRGTRNFPEQGGRKLYGELTMNITVDAAGRLVEADIVRSSGNKVLDGRAVAIVQASSPFGMFTQAMRRQADQIVVTSRFRFTREDGLEAPMMPTELVSTPELTTAPAAAPAPAPAPPAGAR